MLRQTITTTNKQNQQKTSSTLDVWHGSWTTAAVKRAMPLAGPFIGKFSKISATATQWTFNCDCGGVEIKWTHISSAHVHGPSIRKKNRFSSLNVHSGPECEFKSKKWYSRYSVNRT